MWLNRAGAILARRVRQGAAIHTPHHPLQCRRQYQLTPLQPVELEAQTAVNGLPVTLSLRGEPPGDGHVRGPWQITLLGEAGDLSLRVEGSVADPTDWRQGRYRLDLQGRQLDNLETLSGYPLPAAGPYEIGVGDLYRLGPGHSRTGMGQHTN